jgi:hypothetical protein
MEVVLLTTFRVLMVTVIIIAMIDELLQTTAVFGVDA